MKEISFRSLPPSLRTVADVFKENVVVYECDNMNEIVGVSDEENLEMTVINQMDPEGNSVERHFFIGCGLDIDPYKSTAEKKPPRLYFAEMSEKQFEAYRNAINERLLNKKTKSNLII